MGYLAAEILALIAGAALLGVILGWAMFGLKRTDADASKLHEELENEREQRKKIDQRVRDAEAKEAKALERLQERDTTIAELRHQNDEIARIRVQTAMDLQQRDLRIAALESQLKTQDASSGTHTAVSMDVAQALEERDRTIVKLKAELDHTLGQMNTGGDAARVRELERENAELRAALVLSPDLGTESEVSPSEELGRLKDEVRALRAAYEAAEQSLDEQEQLVSSLRTELSQLQKGVGPKTERTPTLDFDMDRESERNAQLPPTKREDRLGPPEQDSMTAALVDLVNQIESEQKSHVNTQDMPVFTVTPEMKAGSNSASSEVPVVPATPKTGPVKTQPVSVTSVSAAQPAASAPEKAPELPKAEAAKPKPTLASGSKPAPASKMGGLLSGSDLKAKLAERANQAKPASTRPNPRVTPTQTLTVQELPQTTEETRPAVSGVQASSIESTFIAEAIPANAKAKAVVPEQSELNVGALESLLAQIEARAAALLPELPKLETKSVSKHIAEPLQEIEELTTLQAERLDQVGVRTFKQLAELSDNDVAALAKWFEVTPEFIREQWMTPAKARVSA